MSETALKHIEYLSTMIGPRGSATPKEKEAHDYVGQVFGKLGYAVHVETFQSGLSAYSPFALALGLMLLAEAIFWVAGRTPNAQMGALAASALAVVVSLSALLELRVADNPLRWFLPVATSRNVIGSAAPDGQPTPAHRRTVVVMAHVDTHRTPFIWHSRNTYQIYRILSTAGVVSLWASCVIFVLGIFSSDSAVRTASLIPAAVIGLAFLMTVQGHFTAYTPGANDNASGVGVLLSLAERIRQEPLRRTEVWWLATGCEEVGAYGSADFVRRHKTDLQDGTLIVVDNIGGHDIGPTYLRSETFLQPLKYPTDMLALAEQIAADHPELKSRAHDLQGAYTDAVHALKAGLKCLTFVGLTRRGWIPNWHNKSDVFANIDADAVDCAERFVWEILKKLDASP